MFYQSLSSGSKQAQETLQRLTEFLEYEGNEGRVAPMMQKRILGKGIFTFFFIIMLTIILFFFCLDVLLAALADCLTEHPELLSAAQKGLGAAIEQLPKARAAAAANVHKNIVK